VERDGIGVVIKEEFVVTTRTEEKTWSVGVFCERSGFVVAVVVEVAVKEELPVGVWIAVFRELLSGDPIDGGVVDASIVVGIPEGV